MDRHGQTDQQTVPVQISEGPQTDEQTVPVQMSEATETDGQTDGTCPDQ